MSPMTPILPRWQKLLLLLKAQLAGAPEITVKSTRQQVRRLYDEATRELVRLPRPDFHDVVFEGMSLDSEVVAVFRTFASEEAKRREKRAYWREVSRRKWDRIAAKLGYKRRRHRQHSGPHACLCGCGRLVRGSCAPGHHTLWIGWMRRIERREMPRGCLPRKLQETLKWTRCQYCGGWIPTTDTHGRPVEARIGYECQRRARVLERRGATESKIYQLLKGKGAA
jgi:hypothetical protein